MTFPIDTDIIVTIIVSVFASSGFWAYLMNRQRASTAERRMILGIGYRSICSLCETYLKRGYISREEYSDLKKYLFEPYKEMGGNGTCARLIQEVDKLPIRENE